MNDIDTATPLEEVLAGRTVTHVKRERDWIVLYLDNGMQVHFRDIGALTVHPDRRSEN